MKLDIFNGWNLASSVYLLISIAILLTFTHDIVAMGNNNNDMGNSAKSSSNYGKRYTNNILQGVKLNDAFDYNDTLTTRFGPAYANVWEEPSNFLACLPPNGRKISYALCYYSGPDQPTGNSSENPSLPCKLSPDGIVADCTCYEISTEFVSPKLPYFVDIHAISNLEVYQQTVEACGQDGLKCKNGKIVPPVCDAINSNLLVPGADAVSVFSPLFIQNYQSPKDIKEKNTSTSCRGKKAALYAGCMTAPCYKTGEKDEQGRDLMECKCPVYDGPYQIGQADQKCDANEPPPDLTAKTASNSIKSSSINVWSAAFSPDNGAIKIPDGACVPDIPGSNGCELYDPGKDYAQIIKPDGSLCSKVCSSYNNSTINSANQVGYSCDSTLCTTLGIGQGDDFNPAASDQVELLNKACDGISKMSGMDLIMTVETLAECSCCASQVCECDNINSQTDQEIYDLNQEQREANIKPQCDINNTLCGSAANQ